MHGLGQAQFFLSLCKEKHTVRTVSRGIIKTWTARKCKKNSMQIQEKLTCQGKQCQKKNFMFSTFFYMVSQLCVDSFKMPEDNFVWRK